MDSTAVHLSFQSLLQEIPESYAFFSAYGKTRIHTHSCTQARRSLQANIAPPFFYTQYCRKPDGARLEINHVITNDGFSEEDSKIAS